MKHIPLLILLFALGACAPKHSSDSPQPLSLDDWAHLSWTPPTENTDGSVLTNLAGYKIYYGTTSGEYNVVITLDNPSLSEYLVENLPTGYTYYFVITAFNSSGVESGYSVEGFKSL